MNFNIIHRILISKEKIKEFIVEHNIRLSQDLGEKLKKIRDNRGGYNIDLLVTEPFQRAIVWELTKKANEEDEEWVNKHHATGTIYQIDEHYFRRRNEIWPIICNQSIPNNIQSQLRDIRECYALCLWEAAVTFCRILIELGAFEKLRRKGIIGKNIIDISNYKLKDNMQEIKNMKINSEIYSNAWQVIKLANNILHRKIDRPKISEDEAYHSIKLTVSFIEAIFK